MSFVATWLDLETVVLSKVTQTERRTDTTWHHLYVESKKTMQISYETEIDSQN